MALFVDLDDDDVDATRGTYRGIKPVWNGNDQHTPAATNGSHHEPASAPDGHDREEAHESAVRENPNRNSMTEALGCYP
jgi:hypothetical protein